MFILGALYFKVCALYPRLIKLRLRLAYVGLRRCTALEAVLCEL